MNGYVENTCEAKRHKPRPTRVKLTKEQKEKLALYNGFKEEWINMWPDTEMPLTKEMWLHATISPEYREGLRDGMLCIKKMNDKTWEDYYKKYPKINNNLHPTENHART